MTVPLNDFKLSEHVKTGIWFDFKEDVRFKLSYSGRLNPKAQAIFERIHRPFKYQIQHNAISEEKSDELARQFYAEAIVQDCDVDWNGTKLTCDKESLMAFFKEWPLIFEYVKNVASDMQNFLEKEISETAKN